MGSEELEDAGDTKKYLEEVMGIVEDEEFNRERRRKLKVVQIQEAELEDYDRAGYGEPWCCTKVLFFLLLTIFLTCSLLVLTNYKEDDTLGLRRMIQEDPLSLSRLGFILDTDIISKGINTKDLNNLPNMLLNGISSLISELKPILLKLLDSFQQKWLTPSVRVYKDNFPFLKAGENSKKPRTKESLDTKDKSPETVSNSKDRKIESEENMRADSKQEEEKMKDFKRLQEKRRISSKDTIKKEEKKGTRNDENDIQPKKELNE